MMRREYLRCAAFHLVVMTFVVCRGNSSTQEISELESPDLTQQLQDCITGESSKIVVRSAVSAREFQSILAVEKLETLELYNLQLDAGAVAANIRSLPQLKHLRLEGCEIEDEALTAISELERLEVLNLPDGTFTDAALSAVARMPNLRLLRFRSPNVSDEGLVLLAKSPALRFLHLMDVPITDAGLASFEGMSQLESFYIDGGNETEAGIASLLKSNPRLHFHRNQLHVADDPNVDVH